MASSSYVPPAGGDNKLGRDFQRSLQDVEIKERLPIRARECKLPSRKWNSLRGGTGQRRGAQYEGADFDCRADFAGAGGNFVGAARASESGGCGDGTPALPCAR